MKKIKIIETLIKRFLLPKYPFLKFQKTDVYPLPNFTEFSVRFSSKKNLDSNDHVAIDHEMKNLFKMAGLDEVEKGKSKKDKIMVWFKDNEGYSFKAPFGYVH